MMYDTSKIWYQGCGAQLMGKENQKKNTLHRLEKEGKLVSQSKRDGIWSAIFSENGHVRAFSRNKKEKNVKFPSISRNLVVVGELGYGSQESRLEKERTGHDFVDIFDILYLNNLWLGNELLSKRIEILSEWHESLPNDSKNYYRILPLWTDDFVGRYEKEHEGLILKDLGTKYKLGYREPKWIKVKKEYDWDMVVVGWTLSDAESKTAIPMAKSIKVGQFVNGKLTELCSVGSVPRKLCADIAANFEKYRGKVMVIHGYHQFVSGATRHASFVRFRDDKQPEECILNETSE